MEEDVDRAAEQLLADLAPVQAFLVESAAFQRMATSIRCKLYRDDRQSMDMIRSRLLGGLPTSTASFAVDLDLRSFMRSQYGDDFPSVGSVIAIVGSALYAQATTCLDYACQTWPRTGGLILHLLDAALRKDDSFVVHEGCDKRNGFSITVELHAFGRVLMCAEGCDDAFLLELAQQLAWLGSALAVSPFGHDVSYAKPTIYKTSSAADFLIQIHHEAIHDTEEACWFPLFSGAVIALGFPILPRADELGLEIPLEVLAGLAGVRHAVEFDGGVVMKGFSQMLVPVSKSHDRIQWHAVSSDEQDGRLRYQDGINRCGNRALSNEVTMEDVHRCRAIVGWCSVVQSRLGADSANYENIDYSGAEDASSPVRLAGGSLGFQQIGTGAIDFKFGVKDGKCHLQRTGPYRSIVAAADRTLVVLYDTSAERAWLVPASEVILHIIQHRHCLDPYEANGKRIHLDTNMSDVLTARKVLLKHESLFLTDDESQNKFRDAVLNVWSILEFLVDQNVTRERQSSGHPMRTPFRESLDGFEFKAVVNQDSPIRQKRTSICSTNGGWPLLVREIDALVLMANGFEDVLLPADSGNSGLCKSWRRLPRGKDYLATSTRSLEGLYDVAGCRLTRKFLTSNHLQWNRGNSILFEDCQGTKSGRCKCDRLQHIAPESMLGTVVAPEYLVEDGAVIFGSSGSLASRNILAPTTQGKSSKTMYKQQNEPFLVNSIHSDEDEVYQPLESSTAGVESSPGSLTSDTTISEEGPKSDVEDFPAIETSTGLLSKRQRVETYIIDSDNEDLEALLRTTSKRTKTLPFYKKLHFGQENAATVQADHEILLAVSQDHPVAQRSIRRQAKFRRDDDPA